jgi:hypothetical protein
MSAPKSRRSVLKRGWKWLLGKPWWQGVGAVVGALALATSIVIAIVASTDSAGSRNSDNHGNIQNGTGNIQGGGGDCNIQGGSSNSLTCQVAPTPQSRGQVTIEIGETAFSVFAGPPTALPTPPAYSIEAAANHFPIWRDWLLSTPTIYFVNPRLEIRLESGEPDLVVLKGARVSIYARKPIRQATSIECLYEGGGVPGYTINVDTVTGTTRYSSEGDGNTASMPPGAIEVSRLHYQGVEVHLVSQTGYFYEGTLTVTYAINGKDDTYVLGTPTRPLRWTYIGADGSYFAHPPEPFYDWHPIQKRWVSGFDPFNIR